MRTFHIGPPRKPNQGRFVADWWWHIHAAGAAFRAQAAFAIVGELPARCMQGIKIRQGRFIWPSAGKRAAAIMHMLATAKVNGHEPHAWLVDVLADCRLPSIALSATGCLTRGRQRPNRNYIAKRDGFAGRLCSISISPSGRSNAFGIRSA